LPPSAGFASEGLGSALGLLAADNKSRFEGMKAELQAKSLEAKAAKKAKKKDEDA